MKIKNLQLLLPALLVGCAAGSVKDMRESATPENKISVVIDQNYQTVYKRLLDKLSECLGEAQVGLFANMHIKSDIFSELREARVSYMMTNLGTQSYYFHANIAGTGIDTTKLDGFVYYGTWRPILPKLAAWASKDNAPCDQEEKQASAN